VPDAQALSTPFAEETGAHLLAMLRAAARARLGHDAPTALAEIAAHARELRGAAATVRLEHVAAAALGIERDALAAADPDAIAVLADTVAALHDGLALILRGQELLSAGRVRPAAAPAPAPQQATLGGPAVLVVDDSPVTRRVHSDLLHRAGFEVRGARDGADALSLLRAAPTDVIVSDVDMAPMDGLTLLRALREDPATAEVPFVFVSARCSDAIAAACGDLHVHAVLSKGAAEQHLPATVHAALAGGQRCPPARVLVADDSALVRSMMRDHLMTAGYEVLEAQDGEDALARVHATAPDVVLLDRDMPRLDGLAVLDAMQADEATAAIPVVFVTGRATALELAEGLGHGAHDYVRKPVEAAELVARVRSALRTRRLRDELRERNLQLESMARTDVLTGMVGRRHGATVLAEACTAAAATGESLAVVMADVDHFKHVNDHHGHAAGDVVLRAVADVMRDGLVTGETAVRWGGEEFLLVLPGCETSGALARAERLRSAVAGSPVDVGGRRHGVTASLGCAILGPGETPEALVARADQALYAAKAAGRDRVSAAA
jgi:two-component system cell cycle response regulator